MKNLYLKLIVFCNCIAFSQDNSVPFHNPMPSKNYEFMRYGDIGANEYRGLANINIGLHSISDKNFNLSLDANYYSGGIKVSEEAGIIGLGWNIDFPTIVQQVNSYADFLHPYKYKKLPPFQGNPAFIPNYPFRTLFDYNGGGFNLDLNQYVGFSGYQNIPYFALVHEGVLVDYNGTYNGNGKYIDMLNMYNTEPDIFSLNLNGENIKFCMQPSDDSNFNDFGEFIYPFVIINGKKEYKIEAIPNDNVSDVFKIKGIKVIDPSGIIYFFNAIEITGNNSTNYASIVYKVSKIILINGKEINFTYADIPNIYEIPKLIVDYHKRLGPTNQYSEVDAGSPTSYMTPPQYYTGSYGNGGICFNPANGNSINFISTNFQNRSNYRLLTNIESENEQINLMYSDRLDYLGMKKLDSITVKNKFNNLIKKINFNYDYFNSNQNNNVYPVSNTYIDKVSKRLKLNSIQFEGQNPYLFEYNSILLPKKNSYSYDFWGFYNGYLNSNPYPNLSHIGYPQFTDNSQNNFKPNINYTKAASLEKIIYPTGGHTLFEYETHEFDNYLLNQGSNTPIISNGAGLRIKSITDIDNNNQIKKVKYSYFNGINISKKILTKQTTSDCFSFGYPKSRWITQILSCNLNNYLNSTSDTNGDYIGYSKVIIEQVDSNNNNNGLTEKYYSNSENKCVDVTGAQNFYANPIYYTDKNKIENGKFLKEIIKDKFNSIKRESTINYENITLNQNIYAMRTISAGFHMNIYWDSNTFDPHISPSNMLTFYPVYDKFSRIKSEKTTEYYTSGNKITTLEYFYNTNNIFIGKKKRDQFGNYFYEESSSMTTSPELITRNILNLPASSSIKENGFTKKYANYLYNIVNNNILLSKIEELPEGNPDPAKKINIFYDQYDDKNNLIQYHKENDIYISIVWGYNKTLPLAKIENVQYNSIQPSLITALQSASDNRTENQLLDELNNLRNSLPNAMITTYTHKPLVGVLSITDENGNKISYHYDIYNRLKYVKDKDDKILNKYEYHFKL